MRTTPDECGMPAEKMKKRSYITCSKMMKPMLSQRARSDYRSLPPGAGRRVHRVGLYEGDRSWGTSIKINEYLTIYGFDYLIPASMVFSIWLCGAEMMMGCMLLCKVRIRLVSIFALASMLFFTILTFLSATFIPVEDCGCFGEAIKLSPGKHSSRTWPCCRWRPSCGLITGTIRFLPSAVRRSL